VSDDGELLGYVLDHYDDDVAEAVATLCALTPGARRKLFRSTKRSSAAQLVLERKLERQRKSMCPHSRDDYARERTRNLKGLLGDDVRRIRGLIEQKTGMARVPQRLLIEIAAEVLECRSEEVRKLINYGNTAKSNTGSRTA